MATYQTPKGTYDILPDDWAYWSLVIGASIAVAERFGYRRIDTPIFETTDLFTRSSGESSDVVTKEMYTFDDKGGRSLTLRPEGTAPVVRSYLQHGMHKLPQPVRLYYVGGPFFRYDEVQEGRQRQFHQFGVEALGDEGPAIDTEVIALLQDVYRVLGLQGLDLAVNSTGCMLCRPAYIEHLVAYYRQNLDRVCEDDHRRLEKNPLRVLDCKRPGCQAVIEEAPRIVDHLGPECRDHWDEFLRLLDLQGIPYAVSHRLVRGLDYYTKTAFEFWPPRLGAQSTIGGGGRYDGLAQVLGGPPTPGIGFGSGMERIILNLRAQGVQPPREGGPLAYVAPLGEEALDETYRLLGRLRGADIGATTAGGMRSGRTRKLGDQLRRADAMGTRFALIVGSDEIAGDHVTVRHLQENGRQETVPSAEIVAWLQEHI